MNAIFLCFTLIFSSQPVYGNNDHTFYAASSLDSQNPESSAKPDENEKPYSLKQMTEAFQKLTIIAPTPELKEVASKLLKRMEEHRRQSNQGNSIQAQSSSGEGAKAGKLFQSESNENETAPPSCYLLFDKDALYDDAATQREKLFRCLDDYKMSLFHSSSSMNPGVSREIFSGKNFSTTILGSPDEDGNLLVREAGKISDDIHFQKRFSQCQNARISCLQTKTTPLHCTGRFAACLFDEN